MAITHGSGTCSVTATRAADNDYLISAPSAPGTTTINKATQATLTVTSPTAGTFGDKLTPAATGGSGSGALSFSASGTACAMGIGSDAGKVVITSGTGTCSVTATKATDADYLEKTSAAEPVTISKAAQTTVTITMPTSAVFGQAGLSATASGGSGSGAYSFDAGASSACSVNATTGALTITHGTGTCAVTATRAGDNDYLTSAPSAPGTTTVDRASTTTTTITSLTPSVFGQSVTFTATVAAVAPGSGTPTGSVQFSIDGVAGATVALDGSGKATYSTAAIGVGSHTVSAVYATSANFNTSTGSLAGGQTVGQATTATSVSSSGSPSVFGTEVTFTATITPVAPGAGTPTGSVQFEIDGTNIGSAVSLNGGQATYATSALTVSGSPHTVKAYYSGSTSFVASNGALLGGQAVTKAPTTTKVTVTPTAAQYSDVVTFTAVISPADINGITPATTATFKVGTQTMGSATFALVSGQWTATLANQKLLETDAGQMAPGSRTVTASIGGINPNFAVSDGYTSLTINAENAQVDYSGLLYVSTASASATTANVTLRATISDITAIDPVSDPNAGDIRNARVAFVNRDVAGFPAYPGCANLTPVLVDPANTKVGTVSCTVSMAAGTGSDPSATYTVGTVVTNYYDQDDEADDQLITVTMGGTGFVTGGGYLVASASSGTYSATAGSKTNFGFNVKFNKSGSNLQGHVNVIVRQKVGNAWKVYQIKSNSISSLTPTVTGNGGTAVFASKANLTDITNPLSPIALGGNLSLEMQLLDNGEPGSTDKIAFTLWNGSTLFFSSNWVSAKTDQQLLGGGNLQVR